MKRKQEDFCEGLTLVETVVAILIAGIVLVGILEMFLLGASRLKMASNRTSAIALAQGELEYLRSKGYDNIDVASDSGAESVIIDEGKTAAVSDDINGTMTTQISQIGNAKRAIVTVNWTGPGYGDSSEIAETVFYDLD